MSTRGLHFLTDATVHTGTDTNTNMSQRPKRKTPTSLGDGGDTGIIPHRVQFRVTNLKNGLFETFKNSNSGVVIKASIWVSTPKVSFLWEF